MIGHSATPQSQHQHLSEDQLTEIVLDGAPPQHLRAHLAQCLSCRERVEQELTLFGSSIDSFNQASLAWSEAQPRPAQPTASRSPFRTLRFAPAGISFAALALGFLAVPVWQHGHPATGVSVASVHDSSSEIADDNRLMQSVDLALAANDPSPLQEYQLSATPGPASKTHRLLTPRTQ